MKNKKVKLECVGIENRRCIDYTIREENTVEVVDLMLDDPTREIP